jgi:hypothetical protein
MQKIMTQMKRNQIVDPNSGRVDLRYNPMSIDEDYFIPIRGNQSNTKIDTLQGGTFTSAIEDVKYLRDKLFSAIKIPQAYLARGEGQAEDKTMLAQKDMRFAKTIQRLQRVVIDELKKIGMIHLYTIGFRNEDLLKFKLNLHNPSKLAELQELEHFAKQLEVAGAAKEQGLSKRWIYENILKMTDQEFVRIQRDLSYDAAFSKNLEAAGGEIPEGGGGLSSALDSESETTPETPETPEGETPEPTGETGKESPLLAAPARRPDGSIKPEYHPDGHKLPYETESSKGKEYTPVAKRKIRVKTGITNPEVTKGTNRNIYKGTDSLIGRLSEEKEDIYENDETLLLEVQNKLDNLDKKLKNIKKVIGENKDGTQ